MEVTARLSDESHRRMVRGKMGASAYTPATKKTTPLRRLSSSEHAWRDAC